MKASVSFIVPAWNEELLLPRTLEAIHAAASAAELAYEIVVADDASTDATREIARDKGAKVVACANRQIAATRNAGARASVGNVLIFVDADTQVSDAAVLGAVEATRGGATYGGCDIVFDSPIPAWSWVMVRLGMWGYRFVKLASGAFLFCTRDAFERAGGFDESLYAGEEFHFSRALRKLGRYAWIEARVVTSARKLRTHSAREIIGAVGRLILGGKRASRRREPFGLWYEERREETQGSDQPKSGW